MTPYSKFVRSLGHAFVQLAADLEQAAGPPKPDVELKPEPGGVRQQQVLTIEGLADRSGLKVAEVSRALGGHDVANTLLTLRSLEKHGLVEMVEGMTPQHWRFTEPYVAQRRPWHDEELTLALDFLVNHEQNGTSVDDLVGDLAFWAMGHGFRGRSKDAVGYKLRALQAAIDGDPEPKLMLGRDLRVLIRFIEEADKLRAAAEKIINGLERE